MSETKWTPGPWSWDGNWLSAPSSDFVLWYTTDDDGVHAIDADRKLISASPELYEACAAFLDRLDHGSPTDTDYVVGLMRAAVNKARGEAAA